MRYTPVRQRKEERASSPPMIFDLCEAKYNAYFGYSPK